MDDRWSIKKPKEGLHTLVGQFSILQFDRVVKAAEELRSQGKGEKEILERLALDYRNFDEPSRKKAYQLSLGLTPKDDLGETDLVSRIDHKETTVELTLEEDVAARFQSGTVVFFEGKRWVVTSKNDRTLVLKQF